MTLSDLKFTATQCLYTLVLNNPTIQLVGIEGLNKDQASHLVRASYDLAEMMLEEGTKRDARDKKIVEEFYKFKNDRKATINLKSGESQH